MGRHPSEISLRALTALALLLSLGLFGGTCTQNAGRVFGGGAGGDGGDDPVDPPREPGPVQPVFAGALVLSGAPTLDAIGPADAGTSVDVLSPIALWFSESVAQSSVSATSLGIRRAGTTVALNRNAAFYAGNRCVVLIPSVALTAGTEYEVFATDGVHDLSGVRLGVPDDGVLSRFTTSAASVGLEPQVVASFPPANASNEPHNSDVVVVFSKPVNYATAVPNIRVERVNSAGTVLGDAAFDAPASADEGGRVFPYLRTEGSTALDLGSRFQVSVSAGVEDTEFNVNTLQTNFRSAWNSLNFGPPSSLSTAATFGGEDQALNLALLGAFPVRATVTGNGLTAGDQVKVCVGEATAGGLTGSAISLAQTASVPTSLGGSTELTFSFDFRASPTTPTTSILSDGELAISAWTERNGMRSLATNLDGIRQDTVAPSLTRFGPPIGSSSGTFTTDLPELRPYGIANESIAVVEAGLANAALATQTITVPSDDSWFLGPVVEGVSDAKRFSLSSTDFEMRLTDAAGNPMASELTGRAAFRSFVGDTLSTDNMTVQIVDAQSLAPIFGSRVQIEAADGSDFRPEQVSLVGEESFSGLAGRAYNITVSAEGYHTATYFGVRSTVVSLPLRPTLGSAEFVSPLVTLANANSGEVRVAAGALVDADRRPEPDGMIDVTVPFGFDSNGVFVEIDRPTWFGGYFRLSSSDPFSQFAIDPRVVVDPFSASTSTSVPALEMQDLNAVSRVIYPVDWPAAAGDPELQTSGSLMIPGLIGSAPVGIGEDLAGGPLTLSSSVTVADPIRDATVEYLANGAADFELDLIVRALRDETSHVTVRIPDASEAGPNTVVWPNAIPNALIAGLDVSAFEGTAIDFVDSLDFDGEVGYYYAVIDDGTAEWDLWIPASVRAAGIPVFPTLDTVPLDDNVDAAWEMTVDAFAMPAGFSESGLFFRVLRRDFQSWVRSTLRTITS